MDLHAIGSESKKLMRGRVLWVKHWKRAHFYQAVRRRRNKKLYRVGGHKRCRIKKYQRDKMELGVCCRYGGGGPAQMQGILLRAADRDDDARWSLKGKTKQGC
jgi:hypothetical protein